MVKPVIFAIDDDREVLRAIERDLKQEYGNRMRVLSADSGATALKTMKELIVRDVPIALFLVDQRMPGMTGVEFLEEARKVYAETRPSYPEAKRVLLTAYAETDAAIRAINLAKLDYYLLKPWDPPSEHLYPVLNDLLDDWEAHYRPRYQGIRVIGQRWSAKSHEVREFLARYQVAYQWLDIDTEREARTIVELAAAEEAKLPLVLFPNGTRLSQPDAFQLAQKMGLQTRAQMDFYDLIVVGAGPAGLAAGVYGASEGLRTLLIERVAPGGQAGTSSHIDNYLGFPMGLSGADLARRAETQARRFGVEILSPQEVMQVRAEDPYRYVTLADGTEISCHALLIATGVSYRKLDVPGLDALTGAGVYYGAALTEGMSCRDEDVYIIGGANSAGQAAMFFSQYARKVVMLVRGGSLAKGMSQYLVDQIQNSKNIEVQTDTIIVGATGTGRLEQITTERIDTRERQTVPAASLFIMIGAVPHTDWLADLVARDDHGFVCTGPDTMHDGKRPTGWKLDRDPFLLETSRPGVFAAGDARHGSVKRCAAGVGEGSMAVQFVHQYLSKVGS